MCGSGKGIHCWYVSIALSTAYLSRTVADDHDSSYSISRSVRWQRRRWWLIVGWEDPEHREETLELAEMLVEGSNQEEGTIDYRATTDIREENTIRFFEQYENEEAFEATLRPTISKSSKSDSRTSWTASPK